MEAKLDRRKERTRRLLRDALMELIVEKGYESITVQDITERADIARPTFYLHYKDKDELLLKEAAAMYDELGKKQHEAIRKKLEENGHATPFFDTSDFDHVAEYADFYRVMLSEKGSLNFFLGVLRYLRNITEGEILSPFQGEGKTPRLPIGLIANCMAWQEAAIVDWWLREGSDYSAEQVAQMQYYLCLFGLAWAFDMNLPPPDVSFP
jgi:AcrR family transcriptional regulator